MWRRHVGAPGYGNEDGTRCQGRTALGLKSSGKKSEIRRTYDATYRLSLTAKEVRAHSKRRHEVEEVIRTTKSQWSLAACQAGYTRSAEATPRPKEGAQAHHGRPMSGGLSGCGA